MIPTFYRRVAKTLYPLVLSDLRGALRLFSAVGVHPAFHAYPRGGERGAMTNGAGGRHSDCVGVPVLP